jgi:hypothetical protein
MIDSYDRLVYQYFNEFLAEGMTEDEAYKKALDKYEEQHKNQSDGRD